MDENLTASEQATIHFYRWECRYRGYYHFDTPIDSEIPYVPFRHVTYSNTPIIDDGHVPSLFESIGNLLLPKVKEPKAEEEQKLEPTYIEPKDVPEYVGFSVSFHTGQEIVPTSNIEFLNMLSFTEHSVSFEIVGTKDSIVIQFVCSNVDKPRVASHLKAYFPAVILRDVNIENFGFCAEKDIAIADFGINDEFMRPITAVDSFVIDPLTSIIATMESLHDDDVVVFQTLFKGITTPLAKDISYAVSDGQGGSFFSDAPEMPKCAEDKIANPLFSVVMRIATQGNINRRSQYLAQELARSITSVSTSRYNKLIPLSNEGYNYDFHKLNLHNRLSNRLGFILNSKELNTFVHYPNKSIVSEKLGFGNNKTKKLPQEALSQKDSIGTNTHNDIEEKVSLNDEARLKHIHIIGATGVGKSTLIANMMIEDMTAGNGCCLFDPHGDIVEDILLRISEHRKNDVILIDPSNLDFPVGFNLLQAQSEAEKIVLSSDLVSSFKRHATAWGDNMTAVLSNAINAFLESTRDGTLIELKRFLLEESFRKEFLTSVDDPSIHYYWNNEYAMVKKGIAPLLTRIDTFLRPKVIRYMMVQTGGVDFKKCIEEKKIVLIKLSQGLIGEENSFLLASIFLSKFNQAAQGRQSLSKTERHPYYIYLDEFQNFITPSITRILSGARKYGLGLVLAHQELGQIDDSKILNSVISNPYTRICFRLGDNDAKRLESGFSYFEHSDLQSLGTGEAIMRVGSSQNDFNLSTFQLRNSNTNAKSIKDFIIENTRNEYAQPKEKLDELLIQLLPKQTHFKKETKEKVVAQTQEEIVEFVGAKKEVDIPLTNTTSLEKEKEEYLDTVKENDTIRKHRYLQNNVRALAQQRGFKATLEEETKNGGRVDIALSKDDIRVAVEISVTNTLDYEVKNIQKCIDSEYNYICMLSESMVHLKNIKKRANAVIDKNSLKKIKYLIPLELPQYLDSLFPQKQKEVKQVRGYRIKSNYTNVQGDDAKDKSATLKNILLSSLRKDTKKKKK